MKKTVGFFVIMTLSFALLAGCGKARGREIPVRELKPDGYEQYVLSVIAARASQEAVPDEASERPEAEDLTDLMPKEGWPAGSVPTELPAYHNGIVANSGIDGAETTIIVMNTSTEALNQYAEELKNAGWIVSDGGSEAVMGRYTVGFQWNDSAATVLQINVTAEEVTGWPYSEIPPDIVPPETGTLVGTTPLSGSDEDGWYFNFTCDDMDQEAASAYMQTLLDSGWEGDISLVCKDVTWNGKHYGASIEIYEIVKTRSTFICGFGLQ